MFSTDTQIHYIDIPSDVELPQKFDYPFQYTPHRVAKLASKEVQNYLEKQTDFHGGFDQLGKMFGVLVVKTLKNEFAYIAAFSGKIDENVHIKGFVPPVYDTLNPKDFFKLGEEQLNQINREIKVFEASEEYLFFKKRILNVEKAHEEAIDLMRIALKKKKKERDIQRKEAEGNLDEEALFELLEVLRKQSIRQSFEFKDFKRTCKAELVTLKSELTEFEKPLKALKEKRKKLSAQLQKRLHESYRFLNAKKEEKDLLAIFKTLEADPPAGTGECCAPKLFQFAYQQNLEPIAMAEFWWGKSPASEIKNHKEFYPACKGKCKPVLGFMLQGLNVAENPVKNREVKELEIQYEDDSLLVLVKPYRFLSVPGREIEDSVYTRMKEKYPEATGPMMVHRLDMGTSGLLLVAKTFEAYKDLQQQFADRTVEKRYIAILEGTVTQDSGTVDLPLRVDYNNRPRQLVCFDRGRSAFTKYEVIERKNNQTKVYLYPKTGRTHQLRVHCAHYLGLNAKIYGDDLYGTTQDRLYLHAEKLEFTHPVTQKRMSFFCESGF